MEPKKIKDLYSKEVVNDILIKALAESLDILLIARLTSNEDIQKATYNSTAMLTRFVSDILYNELEEHVNDREYNKMRTAFYREIQDRKTANILATMPTGNDIDLIKAKIEAIRNLECKGVKGFDLGYCAETITKDIPEDPKPEPFGKDLESTLKDINKMLKSIFESDTLKPTDTFIDYINRQYNPNNNDSQK